MSTNVLARDFNSRSKLIPGEILGNSMCKQNLQEAIEPNQRLIVALDYPNAELAEKVVTELGDDVDFYKIGLQLLSTPEGFALSKKLADKKKNIFLDYKFSDIGNTIRNAVNSVKQDRSVSFLTVMGDEEIVSSASSAAEGTKLKILAVTVLTTLTQPSLQRMGIETSLKDFVLRKAELAKEAGAHGVIASAHEILSLKEKFGPEFLVVTPGIRPWGTEANDQKRTATPYEAISKGADYIVVGRPITQSDDPSDMAKKIIDEIIAGREEFHSKTIA